MTKEITASATELLDRAEKAEAELKVAQQERDEKRLQWQNWRSRMGLTASATELLDRAEKAEAEVARLRKVLNETADLIQDIASGNGGWAWEEVYVSVIEAARKETE